MGTKLNGTFIHTDFEGNPLDVMEPAPGRPGDEVAEIILQSLKILDRNDYDWDGRGALPARDDAVLGAHLLFGEAVDLDGVPTPALALRGDGTVQVAFSSESGRGLILHFQCGTALTYAKVFADRQTSIEGVIRFKGGFESEAADEVQDLLTWLVQ